NVSSRAAVGRIAGTGMTPPEAERMSDLMRRTSGSQVRNSAHAVAVQQRLRCRVCASKPGYRLNSCWARLAVPGGSMHGPADRRTFVSALASLAGVALVPPLPAGAAAPSTALPGSEWDLSWLDRLTGKHKQVFAVGPLRDHFP